MTNQSSTIQAIQNLLETEVAKQNVELHQKISSLQKEVAELEHWKQVVSMVERAAIWHLKALLQSREHERVVHEFLENIPQVKTQ